MVLLGILGKKGHGKDTVADYLVENYGFQKISLADPLKEATRVLFGFTDDQLYGKLKEEVDEFWGVSPRTVFQYLGTDIFRKDFQKKAPHVGDNFWVKSLEKRLLSLQKNSGRYVVADLRFPNEVQLVQKLGGIVVKIQRNLPDIDNHESETAIDSIDYYDKLIKNYGTLEQLYRSVDLVALKHIEKYVEV